MTCTMNQNSGPRGDSEKSISISRCPMNIQSLFLKKNTEVSKIYYSFLCPDPKLCEEGYVGRPQYPNPTEKGTFFPGTKCSLGAKESDKVETC